MARQWDGSVEEEALQEYVPISVMSIITFVCGVIGAFSIYVPEIWPVGVLAIVFGIISVIRSAYRPAMLSWLAYIGVFLSAVAVTWSQTARSNYESQLLSTASEYGQSWLQLIAENRIHEAICLRMPYPDRPLEGVDLDKFFLQTDRPDATMSMMPAPADMKKIFTEKNTIKNLMATGSQIKIRPKREKDLITNTVTGVAEISTFYDVDLLVDGKMETNEIEVRLFRSKLLGGIQWQIEKLVNKTRSDVGLAKMLDSGQSE